MSCPKCISNVDLQLARIEGIRDAKVDMRHGLVTFDVPGPAEPSRAAVSRAILDAGFTLREIRRVETDGGAS
jgi:copper chaperone CopZ